VAHLGRAHAEPLLGLARTVGRPARTLVEAARPRVVLEHPKKGRVVLRRELLLGRRHQQAARARRPGVGLDVDRIQLADRVLVAGAGQMGGGIAQVVAASGRRVSLHDPFPGAVERGLGTMRRSLERLAEKGGADPDETLGRVTPTDQLVAADLMIEAISEDATAKEDVFRRADLVLPPQAILASNTSSIPITSLAAVTKRPEQVIGMHFFNPVPVLSLVEVIDRKSV